MKTVRTVPSAIHGKPQRPIEIIGGGLAGLSLGLALRRSGIEVTVCDAGEYPRHRVCGEFITGLDDATIGRLKLQPILDGALRHRNVAWYVGRTPARVHPLPTPAYGISRYVLDARLAEAFLTAGGTLRTNTRVADLGSAAGRVFATGRQRARSPWLGLKLHVRGVQLAANLELHLGKDAYVGLSRVENDWINVCGLFRVRDREALKPAKRKLGAPNLGAPTSRRRGEINASEAHNANSCSPAESRARDPKSRRDIGPAGVLLEYLHACGLDDLAAQVADAETESGSFCSVAALRFDSRTARVAMSDRIQLGDACAMIPPFTGNGMAMAFQSAAAAVEPLRRYSEGEITWPEACRETNAALDRRFRVRLASADLLHPFLLRRNRQRGLEFLSRAGLLPFRPLYAILH